MSVWNASAIEKRWSTLADSRLVASVMFTAVSLILLAAFNSKLSNFYYYPGWRVFLPLAGSVVVAFAFVGVRYAAFTPLLTASMRACGAGVLVFLLLESPDFTLANPEAARAATYVHYGYYLGAACAIASLFRPSFLIPAAIYTISTRKVVYAISGLPMSTLDIQYMIDMQLYLAFFGLLVAKLGPRIPWLGEVSRQNEIVGAAFGLHLANYFWSGIAKAAAGPTPWYWIFENKTYNQIPYAIESGILPIGHLPWLTEILYKGFQFFVVPLNAAIVLAQLFAIICILRLSWLKIASILYDMLHIGIYVFGGLFFWPWIWNNLTILWAARTSKGELSINTKVACIVTIILGAPALKLNEAAWLGWWDIADGRQIYFEAVTKDNRTVKAPSAFFLSHSYSVSHGYMGHYPIKGQYSATMQGGTYDLDRSRWSGSCPDPSSLPAGQVDETPEAKAARLAYLERFLTAHHEKMLAREARFGRRSYYFHLHHHPSNPFLYPDFNQLSLGDVVGYNLVVASICHSMDEGHVVKRTLAKNSEFFSVQ